MKMKGMQFHMLTNRITHGARWLCFYQIHIKKWGNFVEDLAYMYNTLNQQQHQK